MYSILVADDEAIIREGIKYLFDYEALGFTICAEAATGDQTYEKILALQPDVVLLDIRMPGMSGLDVVRQARSQGYRGKVVIVSSYTDFKYAQEAIRYGVQNYLTKPIDEDELRDVLLGFRDAFAAEQAARSASQTYRSKARSSIIQELLLGESSPAAEDLEELKLAADAYQVVVFQRTSAGTQEPVKLSNPDNSLYDHILLQGREVLLLKGESAILRFREMAEFNSSRDTGGTAPFFACGSAVSALTEVPRSYVQALAVLDRRFFCPPGQYMLDSRALEAISGSESVITQALLRQYANSLLDCIQSFNRRKLTDTLKTLQEQLSHSSDSPDAVRLFLTDLYLQVKEQMHHLYPGNGIPFFTNAAIIQTIGNAACLQDVIWFYSKRFEIYMDATGISTRESVLDDVLHYIQHNYASNITLETIAPLFGYNRSYLGKIFTKKMGQNFNAYVDLVRIEKSKELLLHDDMKVYTVAERVGYKNVDYFHIKFKKLVGQSPAEYRKQHKIQPSLRSPAEENAEKGTLF